MSDDIKPNKISPKQERRAEHLEDKFEKKGMGRDEAEKRALEAVAEEPSAGGGSTAGDPKKGANHEGGRRYGSAKDVT